MATLLKDKKKLALVLSGGGIKAAAFHIGVCLALQEKGFSFLGGSRDQVAKSSAQNDHKQFKLYVGSSAGSFVSAILAAGYSVESLIHAFEMGSRFKLGIDKSDVTNNLSPFGYRHIFNLNGLDMLRSFPRLMQGTSILTGGVETLLKNGFKVNGLFNTKGIERYLRKHALLENEFQNLGVELFVVGTQLNHSRKVIFGPFAESTKTKNTKYVNFATISQAVAASTSLPPVFAPYSIQKPDGKTLYFFDGEIRDTLSTHVATDHGADLVISSYSVQPYHFSTDIGSLHNYGIPVILNQALYQVIQQKIDKHIENQQSIRLVYEQLHSYLASLRLPPEHLERALEIVVKNTGYKPNTDYIYVHPNPRDHEMFFADHFSLSPKILERIVKFGFKACLNNLRQHGI